jgi:hypothetical protein
MSERFFGCLITLLTLGLLVSAHFVYSKPQDAGSVTGKHQARPPVDAAARDAAIEAIKKSISGREDEPAEKVFRNVEILKGKKAARLPGMMMALTGLLGVNCTYCHVNEKWDSEEKPAKQITRKMFKMIGGINNEYFDGKNAVSCWTCHRVNPHPPIQ